VPLAWAASQHNLGNTLRLLGEHGDEGALWRAVTACEAALEVYTREHNPFDWAMTQRNLGNALQERGKRGDNEALQQAVAACKAALEELTRERHPLARAAAQNDLGNALQEMGERGDGGALQRAVTTYETALDELSQEDGSRYVAVIKIIEKNLTRARALVDAPSRRWKFALWSAIQRRIVGTSQRTPRLHR
jgi:tetratricopeptide (TPR) repeat protein